MLLLLLACRQDPLPKDTAADTAFVDSGPEDADGDGFVAGEDCDDLDASVFPDAPEWCNEQDDDCDGSIDEEVGETWYTDVDGDGWGDDATAVQSCAADGRVATGGDCADDDPARHPGASETDCTDPTDYNCDGSAGGEDADGDGVAACEDCDDAAAGTYPGAAETCDGVDQDCDDVIDEGAGDKAVFYEDDDGDGYGDAADAVSACAQTEGLVTDASDCDDRDATVHPGASETCDDIDEDCDGATDEDATDMSTWYLDDDGDGYGDDGEVTIACDAPSRSVAVGGDCDDTDGAVNPGAVEVCDDLDDDCDGDVDTTAVDQDTWYLDADDDGFGDTSSSVLSCDPIAGYIRDDRDCDDADATIRPYAWEDDADGIDNDCDGLADTLDVDVVNDETANLSDDTDVLVEPASFTFPLCGNTFTNFYLESNGRVVFGSSDTDYTESAAEFAADASVAVLWDDLDPRYYAPTVAWVEHDDAIAVYWRDITQYSTEDASTAELVIFDDGRVLLAWGGLDATDFLAGFSCATATSYAESDLSQEMVDRDAGRWGIGDGTEEMLYEIWDGTETTEPDTLVRLCGNAGTGDPCADE